ncbi:MAG: type II toxin-antitoxin system HicA family toxin [Sulfuricella sp.]|jgi:predicted RNA binding protein YcfA (HicA-like mRNA interferase family)|nr:type II toxin-antitoxin system HicA family toxin [Sulfuricella sp.]
MRLPRDLTGAELVRRLSKLGYRQTRQSGSHVRLTCDVPRQHHVTVPLHDPLRIGTLAAILADISEVHGLERDALLERLFG